MAPTSASTRWGILAACALLMATCGAFPVPEPTALSGRRLMADTHSTHAARPGAHHGGPSTPHGLSEDEHAADDPHHDIAAHGPDPSDHGAPADHGTDAAAHGADASAHADPHGDAGGHGGHGGHGSGNFGDEEMALLLMLALIFLSFLFEESKHHIEKRADEHKQIILQALFGELTVLGFIALLTFFLMDSGAFSFLSRRIYGDEDHLLHLFEKVHFGLFFVMVLFLISVSWLIYVQNSASAYWKRLDDKATAYLQEQQRKKKAVERARQARELAAAEEAANDARQRMAGNGTSDSLTAVAPPSVPPPSDDYLKSRYGDGGAIRVGLGVGGGSGTGYARMADEEVELDEMSDDWRLRKRDPELFRFLQLRERFVYGLKGCEGKKKKLENSNTFKLGLYLKVCSASITAHVVHIHPLTWFFVALSLFAVYLCNEMLSHLGTCIVLVLWGWVNVALLFWARHVLHRVIEQLSPPSTASLAQIREGDEDAVPEYLHLPVKQNVTQHDQLWPFGLGRSGPAFFMHLVRTVMLTCAVYVIGIVEIFAREMLAEPGLIGASMVAASMVSVVFALLMLYPVFFPLVVAQKIGLKKDYEVVERTYRQQQINTSIQLLEVLRSMQSHARQLRKLSTKRGAAGSDTARRTAAEVAEEQRRALEYFDKHPRQKKGLVDAFHAYDVTNDGNIDSKELKRLLHSIGQDVTNKQADQLLQEMDADNSGSVSLNEFLAVMAAEVDDDFEENPSHEKLANDLFGILDGNGNGQVTFKEFRDKLHDLPITITDDEIDELLHEMFSGGGDSVIDKPELVRFLKKHYDPNSTTLA